MITKLLLALSLLAIEARGQSLYVYSQILFLKSNGNLLEVKRVPYGSFFYGYDIVDSNTVFYAYDDRQGEASATLAVFDLKNQHETIVKKSLGGVGETNFTYNSSNHLLLFNWIGGIYVSPLFPFAPRLIVKCQTAWAPTWVDPQQFSYTDVQSEKIQTRKMATVLAKDLQ